MKVFSIPEAPGPVQAKWGMTEQQISHVNFSPRRFGSLCVHGDGATVGNVEDEALATMENQVLLGRDLH